MLEFCHDAGPGDYILAVGQTYDNRSLIVPVVLVFGAWIPREREIMRQGYARVAVDYRFLRLIGAEHHSVHAVSSAVAREQRRHLLQKRIRTADRRIGLDVGLLDGKRTYADGIVVAKHIVSLGGIRPLALQHRV